MSYVLTHRTSDYDKWIQRNMARIEESGIRAAQQANAPIPTWFQPWTKKDVTDIVAKGYFEAYLEIEKRANTWSARLRRYASGLISGIVIAILGLLAAWVMGLIGFK